MTFKLGTNVQPDQRIKTVKGWRKVLTVLDDGVQVSDNIIEFGATIYGWKAK